MQKKHKQTVASRSSRRGFFSAQKVCFLLKPGFCGVTVPAGAFFRAKSALFCENQGVAASQFPQGLFFAQKVSSPGKKMYNLMQTQHISI